MTSNRPYFTKAQIKGPSRLTPKEFWAYIARINFKR